MAIAVTVLEWVIPTFWVLTVLWLFNLISQHSVAFYATRARRIAETAHGRTSLLDRFEVRVFLQNLEDVPLKGPYELQVNLDPDVEFSTRPALFAGPVAFEEVQRPGLAWVIRFRELPAYDTWLVSFATREACNVVVRLQEVVSRGKDAVQVRRTLRVLAADTVALPASARHVRSGITSSPRLSTYAATCVLSVAGYLIVQAWGEAPGCQQRVACYLGHLSHNLASMDGVLCASIFVAVSAAYFSGRRAASPFAQGYLQPSKPSSGSGRSSARE
jgi:hypothetical protein